MVATIWTTERIAQLRKLARLGLSSTEAALEMDIHVDSLRRAAKRYTVSFHRRSAHAGTSKLVREGKRG